ncbi:acyl-CoA thioesterase [Terrilactibacillus sp. BCM23-1]|uniref:Acyl-CoA thioesterase n=1 Tax=Terrilactibacillus tamarindi TaxID=2599694 RepID=A0A6N8CL06_9BACI|nr:acyl-CoA thioesterase [Terrilactibacillus tamarindi]MTT30512.1 acyl-CoA thioesterase [Terrilactibacillus tamarindi]
MEVKKVSQSRSVTSSHVLPTDTNNHGTLFGGKLMMYIDDIAAVAATRHARQLVVTASTDSVDFIHPINAGSAVCLEAFVTYTKRTSMEIFVKVTGEDLITGEKKLCTTSFLTFVAVDEEGKPSPVPQVVPETEEEKWLYETAPKRFEHRKLRRHERREFHEVLTLKSPWED